MLRTRSALALLALTLTVGCDDGDPAPAQQGADGAVTADAGADQAVADQGAGDMALADMAPADMAPDMAPPDMDPPAPGEPGPFAVGFHVETIEYAAPELEAPRPLDLHWWYPTAASEGERVRYGNLLLRPEVFGGAPPLADLADAPVLVFSHGNGGFGEQSYFFTEFLASHGWVVVAPDHTGNTFTDSSADFWRLFELRPTDIHAVADYVDALPADHPLAGRVHPSLRALAGHSFGGYTTLAVGGAGYAVDALLAACEAPPAGQEEACAFTVRAADRFRAGFADDRFQALIPMTPAGNTLFGGEPGLAGVQTPTLMMTAGRDATLPNAAEGDPLWAGITQPDSLRVDFPNAGHFSFSNACDLPVEVAANDGCGPDFLPVAEAYPIINGLAMAFLKRHVLGDDTDAALLDPASDFGGDDVTRTVVGE